MALGKHYSNTKRCGSNTNKKLQTSIAFKCGLQNFNSNYDRETQKISDQIYTPRSKRIPTKKTTKV